MDHFVECLVQKKPTAQDKTKQILILAAALLLVIATIIFAMQTGWFIVLVITMGVIYGAYYLFTSSSVEYEYTFTNGELDVDKIIAKRKRVSLLTVEAGKFEAFGEYTDDTPENNNTTLFLCSDNTGVGAYYADVTTESYGAARLIFTPSAEMVSAMELYLPALLRRRR